MNFIPFVWLSFGAFLFFSSGLFTSSVLPYLTEISSFIFWWPSAWECWTKGMSAGCPPGAQACSEASGTYSPAVYELLYQWVSVGTAGIWGHTGRRAHRNTGTVAAHSPVDKNERASLFRVVFFYQTWQLLIVSLMNASVIQNSVINRVKSSLQASEHMLKNELDSRSNHLTVLVYQSVAPQFYLLLEARIHAFSKHNSWLWSTTFVPILPALLFPTTELVACADFLWFSCILSVCFCA